MPRTNDLEMPVTRRAIKPNELRAATQRSGGCQARSSHHSTRTVQHSHRCTATSRESQFYAIRHRGQRVSALSKLCFAPMHDRLARRPRTGQHRCGSLLPMVDAVRCTPMRDSFAPFACATQRCATQRHCAMRRTSHMHRYVQQRRSRASLCESPSLRALLPWASPWAQQRICFTAARRLSYTVAFAAARESQ